MLLLELVQSAVPYDSGVVISTASATTLAIAKQWIFECYNSHPQCNQFMSRDFMPTRLIDLKPTTGKQNPCLVAPTKKDQYVALSYCWGGENGLKLTESNFKKLQEEMPLSELPKTIRDAIKIAQDLGFRYLWVDSLCIIQDQGSGPSSDWTREAKSMKEVYSNATLTIAALSAPSSDIGCFTLRDRIMYNPCWMSRDEKGNDIFVYPSGWFGDLITQCYSQAVLHTRGWVMQERLLSPRTLNFGSFLVWDCRQTFSWEFGDPAPFLQRPFLGMEGAEYLKKTFSSHIFSRSHANHGYPGKFYSYWVSLRSWYSKTQLTRKRDVLIAFSGLIQAFQERTGWNNVAGLWEQFLPVDLLWTLRTARPCDLRTFKKPTWSWITSDAEICDDNRLRLNMDRGNRVMLSNLWIEVDNAPESSQATTNDSPMEGAFRIVGKVARVADIFEIKNISAHFDTDSRSTRSYLYLTLMTIEGVDRMRIYGLIVVGSPDVPGAYERAGVFNFYSNGEINISQDTQYWTSIILV